MYFHMFPKAWKISKLCPVFKTENVNEIPHYRRITIINKFFKVFEIVLYMKNEIGCHQQEFVKPRSTTTNLMCVTKYITNSFDKCLHVDINRLLADFRQG